eukprot:Hpha_TRINITY_DN15356_c1_g1::TRINITY_DN15356_c1_g1_i1::g.90901::m.90901
MAHVPSERTFDEVKHLASFYNGLPAIADRYTFLCRQGDRAAHNDADPFMAPARHPPAMSANDFVVRLCKYAHSSPQVFICSIVFLERYIDRTGTSVNSRNFHRLLLTAFVVAAKLRDDVYYTNSYYASIGGLDPHVVNALEIAMLKALDWEVAVRTEEFEAVQNAINTQAKVWVPRTKPRRVTPTLAAVDAARESRALSDPIIPPAGTAQGGAIRAARSLPNRRSASPVTGTGSARGRKVPPRAAAPSSGTGRPAPRGKTGGVRRKDVPSLSSGREWTTA